MGRSPRRKSTRKRVGHVSYYQHHGSWYIYYLDGKRQVRRRVSDDEETAAKLAAQINAQFAADLPTQFSFTPISVAGLRQRFLEHHEHVARSSLSTISRYRSASQHLVDYVEKRGVPKHAHQIDPDDIVRHLRQKRVTPNGHPHARKRPLHDKTACFVLATCRSMYGFAAKKRLVPPYFDNPFTGLGSNRRRIEDAKPVYVFDADTELPFTGVDHIARTECLRVVFPNLAKRVRRKAAGNRDRFADQACCNCQFAEDHRNGTRTNARGVS